ncbi:Protein timeless-like protein [Microtus ochrogaster]|uniref:Protein timeless-like protein n=1 Tax=Microtus ochrogaster TaxID=79684 RepID=A0A8J6G3Q7_MICOH|nr:Protein timeless-like protein [Microtus ochrogaster]
MAASLNQQEKEEREEERELHPGVPGEQSPSEHRAKALRALLSARKKKAGLVSPEATSEEETPGEGERKIVPRKRELLDSDEDDEGQGPAALGTPVIHKKKRFQIEDDDED